MQHSTLTIRPVSPALGAEVLGVDLAEAQSDATWDAILSAFHAHSVLVFRGQTLSVDALKRFAARFGPLERHDHLSTWTLKDHPEVMRLHNDASKPPGLNAWHTDNSGWERPPLATVLHAKITPSLGGDTMFCNMYRVYESLSAPMRELLQRLSGVHDVRKAFGPDFANLQRSLRAQGIDPERHFSAFEPVEHPIVRRHPATGRDAIYVSAPYVTHIAGLARDESQALLDLLYRRIETHEFIYRHRWSADDLLIWDNRCTQHLAVADYFPHERLMLRMNVRGERPFRGEPRAADR